jgi:putative Ca2+/H+ antiporter (TMEM165/GDT1 family)
MKAWLWLAVLPILAAQEVAGASDETERLGVGDPTPGAVSRFGTVPDFTDAFFASFCIIVCSEIGDKTFFIAAILSMRQNPYVVFAGAISALAIMTLLSVAIGWLVPTFMSKVVAHYAFIALFLVFGFRLVYDASQLDGGTSDELLEVEMELKKKDEDSSDPISEEDGTGKTCPPNQLNSRRNTAVFAQSFVMTFVAEWGDRSQVATIALGAAKNALGVSMGAVIGHALCSMVACIGGKMLATKISERTVAFSGGILFFAFAVTTALSGVD